MWKKSLACCLCLILATTVTAQSVPEFQWRAVEIDQIEIDYTAGRTELSACAGGRVGRLPTDHNRTGIGRHADVQGITRRIPEVERPVSPRYIPSWEGHHSDL